MATLSPPPKTASPRPPADPERAERVLRFCQEFQSVVGNVGKVIRARRM